VTVFRDAARASFISLPVVSSAEKEASGNLSLITIFFLILLVGVLVIAFTLFMRSRLK